MRQLLVLFVFLSIFASPTHTQILYQCNFDGDGENCFTPTPPTTEVTITNGTGDIGAAIQNGALSDVTSSLTPTLNGEKCILPYNVTAAIRNIYFCNNGFCPTPSNSNSTCQEGKFGNVQLSNSVARTYSLKTDSGGINGVNEQCLSYYYYMPATTGQKKISVRKEEVDGTTEEIDSTTSSPFNGWIQRKVSFIAKEPDYKIIFVAQRINGITPANVGFDEISIVQGNCDDTPVTGSSTVITGTPVQTTTSSGSTQTTRETTMMTTSSSVQTTTTSTTLQSTSTTTTTTTTTVQTTTASTTTSTTTTTAQTTTSTTVTQTTTSTTTAVTTTTTTISTQPIVSTSTTTTTVTSTTTPSTTTTNTTRIPTTTTTSTTTIRTTGALTTTTTTVVQTSSSSSSTTARFSESTSTTRTTTTTTTVSLPSSSTEQPIENIVISSEHKVLPRETSHIVVMATVIPIVWIAFIVALVWVRRSTGVLSGIFDPFTNWSRSGESSGSYELRHVSEA